MTVRKYWQRHPMQMRVIALALLIAIPVTTPLFAVFIYWREIIATFADQYRDAWRALVRGE
jgi:hypothetical protein